MLTKVSHYSTHQPVTTIARVSGEHITNLQFIVTFQVNEQERAVGVIPTVVLCRRILQFLYAISVNQVAFLCLICHFRFIFFNFFLIILHSVFVHDFHREHSAANIWLVWHFCSFFK